MYAGPRQYLISFHDGESTHRDGSPFFDIRIRSSKVKRDKVIRELKKSGYVEDQYHHIVPLDKKIKP